MKAKTESFQQRNSLNVKDYENKTFLISGRMEWNWFGLIGFDVQNPLVNTSDPGIHHIE